MSHPRKLVPVRITIITAEQFLTMHHRSHPAPRGALFALGITTNDRLVAVAIVGRPVPPAVDDALTAEVTRTGMDSPQAEVALYRAAWSLLRSQGYRRLITHTQVDQVQRGLRPLGLRPASTLPPRARSYTPHRDRADRGVDGTRRIRWEPTVKISARDAHASRHEPRKSAQHGTVGNPDGDPAMLCPPRPTVAVPRHAES